MTYKGLEHSDGADRHPQQLPTPQQTMAHALQEYKMHPDNPEIVTGFWKLLWKIAIERARLNGIAVPDIEVTDCDRNDGELAEIRRQDRMLVYLPPQLSHADNVPTLRAMFGAMGGFYARYENIENLVDQHGWLDIEATWKTPNTGKSVDELTQMFESDHLQGQTVNTYLLSGLVIQLLSGQVQETESRSEGSLERKESILLGSRIRYPGGLFFVSGYAQEIYDAATLNSDNPTTHEELQITNFPHSSNQLYPYLGARTVRAHQRQQLPVGVPQLK